MRRFLRAAVVALGLALLGASAALASEAGGKMPLDAILWEMGIKILDVGIIAFFAFKYLSKPIAQAMAGRSENVRRALDEATAGRRDAEARLREVQEKNARLESEIQQLVDQTAVDIEREQALIKAEAEAGAERIRQHARETFRQEIAKTRADLHREAADLAVRLAAEHVRSTLTPDDQHRLAGDYFKEMEAAR
jgi:F-type H+-transporting ATPase subunit b